MGIGTDRLSVIGKFQYSGFRNLIRLVIVIVSELFSLNSGIYK